MHLRYISLMCRTIEAKHGSAWLDHAPAQMGVRRNDFPSLKIAREGEANTI